MNVVLLNERQGEEMASSLIEAGRDNVVCSTTLMRLLLAWSDAQPHLNPMETRSCAR